MILNDGQLTSAPRLQTSLLSFTVHRFYTDRFWIRRALLAALCMAIGLILPFDVAYVLTFALVVFSVHLPGSAAWAYQTLTEFHLLCVPGQQQHAKLQATVLVFIWALLACSPLLAANRADAPSFYLAVAASLALFMRTLFVSSRDSDLYRGLVIGGSVGLATGLWMTQHPILLAPLALISWLTLRSPGLPRQVKPKKATLWQALRTRVAAWFPPAGQLNRLLDIRPICNWVIAGVIIAEIAALVLEASFMPGRMTLFYILEFQIIIVAAAFTRATANRWGKNILQSNIALLPTNTSAAQLTAHFWAQFATLQLAMVLCTFTPRILFWYCYPVLFRLDSVNSERLFTYISLVVLLALSILWIGALTIRRNNTSKSLVPLFSAAGMFACIAIVETNWLPKPLLLSAIVGALYLNYRERRLWLRDPAALLAASAGKENL